ncbi:MAG: hypothetical protein ACP5UV_05810 [Thermoplasmata archaeon]
MADLDDILNDNFSGSTELAFRVYDFFRNNRSLKREELEMACSRIISNFPGMALIRNVADRSLKMALNNDFYDLPAIVKKQNEMAAEIASKIIKCRSIVTISNSSMVYDAILRMKVLEKVTVLESRPANEGIKMADRLKKAGINVIIATDASMCTALKESEAAMIGSDSILADGTVINKTGSLPLAICSSYLNKRFTVLSTSMKVEHGYLPENYPAFLKHESSEISAGFKVINYYFEMIPPDLISDYVMEYGTIAEWKP